MDQKNYKKMMKILEKKRNKRKIMNGETFKTVK